MKSATQYKFDRISKSVGVDRFCYVRLRGAPQPFVVDGIVENHGYGVTLSLAGGEQLVIDPDDILAVRIPARKPFGSIS